VRVLAISGSLRSGSYNTALAEAAAALAPDGVDVQLYDGLAEIPGYDPDLDGDDAPEAAREARAAIADADAVLVVTPEYNGSVPGALKNLLDWASRPHRASALWGKTVAVAGTSPGSYGAIWAMNDLRRILGVAGARVVEGELSVPKAPDAFGADGRLLDDRVARALAELLETIAREAEPVLVAA
jgi:chromate reductase